MEVPALDLERESFSSDPREMHHRCRCSWRSRELRKVIPCVLTSLEKQEASGGLGLEKSSEKLDVPLVGNGEETN